MLVACTHANLHAHSGPRTQHRKRNAVFDKVSEEEKQELWKHLKGKRKSEGTHSYRSSATGASGTSPCGSREGTRSFERNRPAQALQHEAQEQQPQQAPEHGSARSDGRDQFSTVETATASLVTNGNGDRQEERQHEQQEEGAGAAMALLSMTRTL